MSESMKEEGGTSATKSTDMVLQTTDVLARFQHHMYSYTNALLTVSSGGIAFLALIISQAISFPSLTVFSKTVLLVAWAAFGLCIVGAVLVHRRFGNIIGFLCAHDPESEDSDSETEELEKDLVAAKRWDTTAIWSFIIAVLSSLAFMVSAFYCNT